MSGREAPLHPAARAVYDEQGRSLSLGLSEAEIRLECVRLIALGHICKGNAPMPVDRAVTLAGTLAAFVLGTDKDHPAQDGAADNVAKQSQVFGRDAKERPYLMFDGSPDRANAIAAWVNSDGRGLVLNPGDVVEMDQYGTFWRVQITTKTDGSQTRTTGPLRFVPAKVVEELRASNAKAAEPPRQLLSEIARSELRRKALALHEDVRRDGHHRENAYQTMVAYDEKIAGIRQQITDIESDLGERFA